MPVPPGMTGDVAAINAAMEQARAAVAPANQITADPGWGLTDEQIAAMQTRIAEDTARMFAEHRAQQERERQGWRPDPNEPDVEIRVRRMESFLSTEIEARFRLRTGEPERSYRSVVGDHELALADSLPLEGSARINPAGERDSDRLLNEHIRMTVDRLCAERRQAEYERQRAERDRQWQNPWYNNVLLTTANLTTCNVQYDWRMYTAATNTFTTTTTNIIAWEMTPEQRARLEAQQAQWEAERKVREAELAAAEKFAEDLLLDVIGRHRYRIWRERGVVHVSSRKYKNLRYEIKAGHKISLHERRGLAWHKRKDALCIHPREQHPRGDEVAALYVLARFDEDELWRTANHHDKNLEPALELAA